VCALVGPNGAGLAATAAVAIDHARRHGDSARQQRWQQASTRITTALLSQADSSELLLITRAAHGEKETLHALASVRDTAGQWDRITLPLPGTVTATVLGSGALVSADLSVDERFPQAETLHPGVGASWVTGRRPIQDVDVGRQRAALTLVAGPHDPYTWACAPRHACEQGMITLVPGLAHTIRPERLAPLADPEQRATDRHP
jgi:hypothetical protein